MLFQASSYLLPLALVAALAAAAGYLGYRKQGPGRNNVWYVATMASLSIWSVNVALVLVSRPYEVKLFWFAPFLLATVYLCVCWFLFAVSYTGNADRVPPTVVRALVLVPVPYFFLTLTNSMHELVLVNPELVFEGGFARLRYRWGPVVWGYVLYTYVLSALATGLLFRKFLHTANVYRKLSLTLCVGGASLWTANMATFAGLSPFPHMLLTPFVFLFWGIIGLGIFTSIMFVQLLPIDAILSTFTSRFDSVIRLGRSFVLEEMESGVLIIDADGRLVDINTLAKRMLGRNDRLLGKKLADIVDLDDYFDDIDDGGELTDRHEAIWAVADDGSERCYDVHVTTIENDSSGLVGRIVLMNDVTEQKHQERRLREREAELHRQTQQLEHQNERLDRFASIVSHDLRNPLNVATGHVGLLNARTDSEQRSIEALERAHERMENIIEDALILARSGHAITEHESIDVVAVAPEAWANVDTDGAVLETDGDLRVDG